jgi:signal-transduction protein with cAMP-binding, CBS, and nucleotidyltransferase domain
VTFKWPKNNAENLLFIKKFANFKLIKPSHMRNVKNILESKPNAFNTIQANVLVINALHHLNSVNLSYLIVMDGEEYKGIFCERDYSRNVILKGRSSDTTLVSEVMTTDLPVVALTDSVEYCMNLMNSHKTRYLLAYDGSNFQGVITIHDLLRQVIANKEDVFDHSIANKLIDQDESSRIY